MSSRASRHDESSMSSLSAGLSAYNAAEPKPHMQGGSVASGAHRSQASGRSRASRTGTVPPGPPPPRGGADRSVAQSYRSVGDRQPRSVDGHSAQSVRSGLSQGTAGRGRGHGRGSGHDLDDDEDDDDQTRDTTRLMGLVHEVTGGGSGAGGGSRDTEERRRMESSWNEEGDDGRSRRSGASAGGRSRGGGSRRSGGGDSRRSRDPDASTQASSRRSRGPPPSGGGSNRSHHDPEGMASSMDFGGDDPDGRQYAPGGGGIPGVAKHMDRGAGGGGGGWEGGPRSAKPDDQSTYRDESYYSSQRGSGMESRASRGGGDGSYYTASQEGSLAEEASYFTRDSRRSGSPGASSRSSGRSRGGTAFSAVDNELATYRSAAEEESVAQSGVSGRSGGTSKKHKNNALIEKEVDPNKRCMYWYRFSHAMTCFIPDSCIKKDDVDAKQAWREKVAICWCVFAASLFFVGIFGFIPVIMCLERRVYTVANIQERVKEDWIAVHGWVYDVTDLFERLPPGPFLDSMSAFLHDDASKMFPRVPAALLPDACLNREKFKDNPDLQSTQPTCKDFTEEDIKNGIPCHDFATGINATKTYLGEFEQGELAYDGAVLLESPFTFWVSIRERVYNVTDYVNDIRNVQTKQIEKDHPMAYLDPTLNNLVINKLNEDATELFLSVYHNDSVLACMDELFYVGIIDTRFDVICFILNILMYFLLCFIALIMVMQMLCSLMYIAKGTRTYTDEDTQDQVIIMVPCYNEGGLELIKTLDSVLATTYPEENKCVFLLADGVVTGSDSDMSTPEHLAEILGYEQDPQNDELFEYKCIGLLTSNFARVYHGYYEVEDKSLKYLVVIKHGLPMEQTGSAKPGNRGKRDSQLIVMGYFNRIYHGRELTELDAAIEDGLIDLNMQSDDMRLLMTIDADTRVDEKSVTHMVYAMNQNDRILALCGETKVDNKWQTWCTMMQVFEYYNNHHMKKAFESAFGCVTCLPGCFTMYRILNDDGKPLLADDHVYAEYLRNDIDSLHEQNLFHLGEDRMLTTLLLHFFPGMFLSYVPEAQCFTIVPHTLRILLSQRRRWINSTYHNLLELTKVKTMCGVCCCSMKTVVWLDLIACMILPASTLYAVYLVVLVASGKTEFSLLLLVLYGLIIGVQIVVFILRSRYDFIFWFIFFTIIGVPVFYLILPLYAFWHMDDFSWGETRKVAAMTTQHTNPAPAPQPVAAEKDYSSTSSSDDESEKESRRSSRSNRR